MPSPFPGMDPYLEAQGRWPGFHNVLIAHCSELLNRDLPESYVAQTDERIALVSFDDTASDRVPDVLPEAPAVVGTIEPTTMQLLKRAMEVRETWIEIYHLPEMELVTAIGSFLPATRGDPGGRITWRSATRSSINRSTWSRSTCS
jgi:hypothetical protein